MRDSINEKNGLSRYRIEKLLRAFAEDRTATGAARQLRLNRSTVNRYYGLFRQAIHARQRDAAHWLDVPAAPEPDTLRGMRTTPVIGLYERDDQVFAVPLAPELTARLRLVLRGLVEPDRAAATPGWPGCNALAEIGRRKALRITPAPPDDDATRFWTFANARLAKFRGVRAALDLHLAECEWRWHRDTETLFLALIAALR